MSETPREAVEFARMVVRAFYSDEFVVLLDAVLRMNNYCAHGKLAQRIGIPAKELRQMLNRMVQARLIKSDKRQQKKVNIHDEKRGTRMVTTEFWYVPLASVVDAFIFRVDKLNEEIKRRRESERGQDKWVCSRCHSKYSTLDILSWDQGGVFICERIGVRADRRPMPCGGQINEEDNSAVIKETERVKQMLDDELRALRERAAVCANLDIPNHPLDGADEKTLQEVVPDTVGMHGERVDEDGIPISEKESAANSQANKAAGKAAPSTNPIDDDVIPDKPSWFKDIQTEDGDDDWDPEQENVMDLKKGTASTINADEEKAYMERYLRQIGGLPPEEQPASSDKQESSTAASIPSAPEANNGVVNNAQNEPDFAQGNQITAVNSNTAGQDEEDDVIVYVAGKPVKMSQVTVEMQENLMTNDEFVKFMALKSGGGNDEDFEDDFED